MKNLLLILMLFSTIFLGCKDNPTAPGTGNPSPNPNIIFYKDSISIATSDTGEVYLGDTLWHWFDSTSLANIDTVNFSFRVQISSMPITAALGSAGLYMYGFYPQYPIIRETFYSHVPFDSSYNFTKIPLHQYVQVGGVVLMCHVFIYYYKTTFDYWYIRIKDITISK